MNDRFWRNNSQICDSELDQDRMVIAEARNEAEAERVVTVLNDLANAGRGK